MIMMLQIYIQSAQKDYDRVNLEDTVFKISGRIINIIIVAS